MEPFIIPQVMAKHAKMPSSCLWLFAPMLGHAEEGTQPQLGASGGFSCSECPFDSPRHPHWSRGSCNGINVAVGAGDEDGLAGAGT